MRLFRISVAFLSRARPIRFKNLSIAVPRSVKRAEVPGACYVTDNENITSPAVGSRIRNSFLSDGYFPAGAVRTYVRTPREMNSVFIPTG